MASPTTRSDAARDRLFAELAEWVRSHDVVPQSRRYGDHPDQVADLRVPPREGPHPVVVLIHGGNWRAAITKTAIEALAVDLVWRGWATWNIEYRRVGTGGGAATTGADVTAAIRALDGVRGLDLQRVIALGHSSGGQLALCAAPAARVAAVVSVSGYCDLGEAVRSGLGGRAVEEFCDGRPEDAPANYDAADPIRRLPLGRTTLLAHGTDDDRVPADQSRSYAAAAARSGEPCELLLLEGAGHFDVIDPRSDHWRAIADSLPGLLATNSASRRAPS